MIDFEGGYDTPIRPELDWAAYFDEFERIHGEPVPLGDRWLYADGWSYSMRDYAGPEYPPPKGKRGQYKAIWRVARKKILWTAVNETRRMIFDLHETQSTRSAPLQLGELWFDQKQTGMEEDSLYRGEESNAIPLDLDPLRMRLKILEDELAELG